jgi:L-rhamnose-H+ transport protein
MLMTGTFRIASKELVLFAGILSFLGGVALCGKAGRLRDGVVAPTEGHSFSGYAFAATSGVISAIFNIGYTLALPIAAAGVSLGSSSFAATNCIWMLMLGAGAIPNLVYCGGLLRKNRTAHLFVGSPAWRPLGLSVAMGLLWGGSIFLYGAATPHLGKLGPSIGWPLSLAVGLLIANMMGVWLGEWRGTNQTARRYMWSGILLILFAIVLCSVSTRISA